MNDKVVGVTVTTGTLMTVNVTLIVTAVPPFGVILTVPAYGVAEAVKLAGFTLICSV